MENPDPHRQASDHCIIYLANELKKRSERLKLLALDHLSFSDIEKTGLQEPQTLDAHASKLHQLLDTYGVCLPDTISADWRIFINQQEPEEQDSGLKWEHMLRPKDEEMSSIFRYLNNGRDAEIFYQQAFRGLQDPMIKVAALEEIPWPTYILWIMEHDPCVEDKRIFHAHDILSIMKHYMKHPRALIKYQEEMEAFRKLYSFLLSSEPTDETFCHCSPEGSNLFTSFWRLYLRKGNHFNTRFMTQFPATLDHLMDVTRTMIAWVTVLDKDFTQERFELLVRLLTFEALDLTHTCIPPSETSSVSSSEPDEDEVVDQIEEEEIPFIKLLEEILAVLNEPSSKLWGDATTLHAPAVCTFLGTEWIPTTIRVLDGFLESHGQTAEEDHEGEDEKPGVELGVAWESDDEDFINPSSLSFNSWIEEMEEIQ